ncbi:MAG TPA: cytochrome P460 family protein [Pyrinomonadaceae bacterium]|nr:cytochrome P460 family protein [Pyrinomonadaceae bacterium]
MPAPPPAPVKQKKDHATAFGVVYANEPAARVLLSLSPGKFPVGSVIVREKLSHAEATKPDLLAVMIKRGPDFNPAGGDWEFLVFDGELKRLRERQKKGSCLECHSSQQSRDFVFPIPQSQQ